MKTNAKMNRKDTDIRSDPCIIEDIVELDGTAYAQFRSNLLQDYDFIGDRKDLMHENDSGWHCLLVLGKGQNDGVLVESEGYSYARYSAHLPEARDFVNAQIKQLADYVVSEGTEHSEDGNWSNSYEEFLYHFDTTVTDTNGIGQLLKEELEQRQEVAECIMAEDCIEMTYHMEYCEQCQQGGTALEKIRMDSDSFQGTEEFGYRTEIIGRMRACILSERLNDGEKVVFIPTEPLDEFDAIRYENGTVKSMDSDNLSCMIDCGQSQQIEIPLKNILAKYNPDTSMCCFGYRHAEPLCGMYDSIAEEMLEQAQKDYELSCEQDDSPVQSM